MARKLTAETLNNYKEDYRLLPDRISYQLKISKPSALSKCPYFGDFNSYNNDQKFSKTIGMFKPVFTTWNTNKKCS